jgi:hypothetical protein
MKKIILPLLLFALLAFKSHAQTATTVCQTFSTASDISTYPDPSSTIAGSVASNELTITFTNTSFWGDEVKVNLPSVVDVTGHMTMSYDVQVVSLTINGTGCSAVNYLPLGISVYDSEGDYSSGQATSGYYDNAYAGGSVAINSGGTNVNYASIAGISIKAASFSEPGCTGTSVTGSLKIKNLKVGNTSAACGTSAIADGQTYVADSKIYPNPSSDLARIELQLKSISTVKVTLSDMMGKELMILSEGTTDYLAKDFSVANLNKGIYTVNYFINGAVAKSEMLMVK